MNTAVAIILLLFSFLLILLSSEIFTNSIEWLGHRLDIAEGAVGSILAGVGTALPETLISIIAIAFGGGRIGQEIGIGAILGAPLLLSTTTMCVAGLGALYYTLRRMRKPELIVNQRIIGRDIRTFLVSFSVAIGAIFLPAYSLKVVVALGLLVYYGSYVRRQMHDGGELGEELAPLFFARRSEIPHLLIVIVQVITGLGLMILASRLFVISLVSVSHTYHIPALILSVVLTPIATELPEKFNSVIWIRQGKDTLALGNITGALVFQSTIPTAIGLLFTDWSFTVSTQRAFASAIIVLLSSSVIFGLMALLKRLPAWLLLSGGAFYALYILYLF